MICITTLKVINKTLRFLFLIRLFQRFDIERSLELEECTFIRLIIEFVWSINHYNFRYAFVGEGYNLFTYRWLKRVIIGVENHPEE